MRERKRRVGDQHPATAVHRNNLAMLKRDRGQMEEAAELLEAVVAIHVASGLASEQHALALRNLASCLKSLERFDEALVPGRAARDMFLSIFGQESDNYLYTVRMVEEIEASR